MTPLEISAKAMVDFLAQALLVFKWTMTNLGAVVTAVTGNPLMMVGFLLLMTGFVIGIFKRLVNVA